MRKRIILLIMACIFLYLSSAALLILKPPLNIRSVGSQFSEDIQEQTIYLLGLENKSFLPINITNVYVNYKEVPKRVEIAISMDTYLSAYSPGTKKALENQNIIQYKSLSEQKIYPQLTYQKIMELRKQGDTETIRYYDLILNHTEPIESVEINYKFLLFKLGVNI